MWTTSLPSKRAGPPAGATWPRCAGATIEQRPTPAGPTSWSPPAPTYGPHPPHSTTSSTLAAPSPSPPLGRRVPTPTNETAHYHQHHQNCRVRGPGLQCAHQKPQPRAGASKVRPSRTSTPVPPPQVTPLPTTPHPGTPARPHTRSPTTAHHPSDLPAPTRINADAGTPA